MKRLVVHAGLPKTGTTALQESLYHMRDKLRLHEIGYPDEVDPAKSKHQFIVSDLFSGNARTLQRVIEKNRQTTVIVSTEGLTNHLYDFPIAGIDAFRSAVRSYEVAAFIVIRDRDRWLESYYKQSVMNSVNPNAAHFGTSLPFAEFVNLASVRRLSDHVRLTQDWRERFAPSTLTVSHYEGDWIGDLANLLGVHPGLLELPCRLNQSVSNLQLEVMRTANKWIRSEEEKSAWRALLFALDGVNHNDTRRAAVAVGTRFRSLISIDCIDKIRFERNPPFDTEPIDLAEFRMKTREILLADHA